MTDTLTDLLALKAEIESDEKAAKLKKRTYGLTWKAKNRDKALEGMRQWRKAHPDSWRESQLQIAYNMSLEDYNTLLQAQNNVCKSCHRPETTPKLKGSPEVKRLAVDHDHKTGQVRGLLCNNCNRALGLLQDSLEGIKALYDYLEAAQKNTTTAKSMHGKF